MVTSSVPRFSLAALLTVVAGAVPGHARCDPTTDPDMSDIANARAAVAANCDCSSATPHGTYVSCAAQQANTVLTNKSCAGFVKKCASHSVCGKGPTAVTCCITTTKGTKCKIKRDSASCAAKQGSVGMCTSCCDACPSPGSGPSCGASTTTLPSQYCAMPGACDPPCPSGQGCAYLRELGCGCVPEPACGVEGSSCGGNCPFGCEPCHLDTFNGQCLCGCAAGASTTSTTATTTTTSMPCVPTGVGAPCEQASQCCAVPNAIVFCGGNPISCRIGVAIRASPTAT